MAEEIREMLSEQGKRALLKVFAEAKQRLIGQPTTDSGARPFPPITSTLVDSVKTNLRNQVINILQNEGYTISWALNDMITDFVNENVDEFVRYAREKRMAALMKDDKKEYEQMRGISDRRPCHPATRLHWSLRTTMVEERV